MLRRLNGPAVVGAVALVVASWLLWRTLPHGDDQAPRRDSSLVVNKAGGYSIRVPEGMEPTTNGKVTRVADAPRTVLITVTPTRPGSPAETSTAVLAKLGSTYRNVDVDSHQRQTVDGRAALASFGRATSRKGVDLGLVVVTVKSGNRSFAITSVAAGGNTERMPPQLRTVMNSFHARPR